jgi:hypothetical protein
MIFETEYDFLEVKNLLERACYNFQYNVACESLADFEDKMGLGRPNGEYRVCEIVGTWCSPYRGKATLRPNPNSPDTLLAQHPKIEWVRSDFSFYQRLIYQMSVQDWIPRGLTIIPLEMEGLGEHAVF